VLKVIVRIAGGTFIAAAVAWFLAAIGTVIVPSWRDSAITGASSLGSQLGLFFAGVLVGYIVLRAVLKSRGKLWQYLVGGAVVGLAASGVAIATADIASPFLPYALGAGVLAGLAGAAPVSGSAIDRPPVVTPIE
jgi:hypothetical protein